MKTIKEMDEFTAAYVECALWSSHDGDENYFDGPDFGIEKLAPETLAKMVADCERFQAENKQSLEGYPATNAGHDLWLTRNHHGAGFWENDHGSEAQCELLTNACHDLGEVNLYLGDDGMIYAE